jgi:ATP-dependent DNA ligase
LNFRSLGIHGEPKDQEAAAVWVKPQLLAEVEYRARSANGKLGHPIFIFKGIRED